MISEKLFHYFFLEWILINSYTLIFIFIGEYLFYIIILMIIFRMTLRFLLVKYLIDLNFAIFKILIVHTWIKKLSIWLSAIPWKKLLVIIFILIFLIVYILSAINSILLFSLGRILINIVKIFFKFWILVIIMLNLNHSCPHTLQIISVWSSLRPCL